MARREIALGVCYLQTRRLDFGPSRFVNGLVHPTALYQAGVGCVHYGIHLLRSDVVADEGDTRVPKHGTHRTANLFVS